MKNDRIKGGILGVIVGDALGLPVQFLTREEVLKNPISGMRGYGSFNYPAGTWSDDGSLTLCTVESLTLAGYNLCDLSERFLKWFDSGYLTPFDESFDIGRTTAEAMTRLKRGTIPLEAGSKDEHSNGNGSLMRILPALSIFQSYRMKDLFRSSRKSQG
jgi:ADP-ribosylglycohydrolase